MNADLSFFLINQSLHMHISDIRMIVEIICERGVMRCEAGQREPMRRQMVEYGLQI